jgi:hypothetical protein
MTRIVSKFGIAAALTFGVVATASAQTGRKTNPTTTVGVSKGEVAAPVHDTVTVTRVDTVRMYTRDTVTVAGPTVTRFDTVSVTNVPGWLDMGRGLYFGLGAGSYYPSAGLGLGQIPGYAFQANLGVDPAGSPLGVRLTANLARPDESQTYASLAGRPTLFNATADLKLRLPFLRSSRFPMFGLYAVGGGAYIHTNAVRNENDAKTGVALDTDNNHWGWDAGGGATLSMGHKRELFLEVRAINYSPGGAFENNHQVPVILGINWY